MATKTVKLNSAECLTCILIGVIGSTIYFMWSDITALWSK